MKIGWEKYEQLKDILGAEELCEEFANAMSGDELDENCDWIARCHEIDFE